MRAFWAAVSRVKGGSGGRDMQRLFLYLYRWVHIVPLSTRRQAQISAGTKVCRCPLPASGGNDPVARAGRVHLTDVLALLYEDCPTEQSVTSHETAAVPSAHQVLDNRESIAFLLNDRFAPTTRMLLSLRLHGY